MFEQLINETASRFNLSTSSVSALVRGLLSLMTDERTGGPEGFVDQFRRAGLGNLITSWFGGKAGSPVTTSQIEQALGSSGLETLTHASGMTRSVVSSVLTFLLPKVVGFLTPNGTLPGAHTLRSQISSFIDRPSVAPIEHAIEPTTARRGRSWWPWAVAAMVALAAFLLFRPSPGTADPQLSLSNRDGKVTYSGVVRDQATRTAIVNGLRNTFGATNISGDVRVDPDVKAAAWTPKLGDLFASARTPGVDVHVKGDSVTLGGWVSEADREALAARLGGVLGARATVGSLGDVAESARRAANEKALSALEAIGTTGVSPDAVVRAMNLGIINFPTGSAQLSADNMEVIRASAAAIQRAPGNTRIEIGGHTDNTGEDDANLALSQARAEAVRSALVSAGVPASRLMAKGYGETNPRATNDTEYGRFQNRRIEYRVTQ